MNRFEQKYQNKSSEELKTIISDKSTFVEDARLAAHNILQSRGEMSAQEQVDIKNAPSKVPHKAHSQTPKSTSYLTTDINAPELHSKKVITIFSVLFSTIFGAVLLMYNMKASGNAKMRLPVLVFGILYTLLSIITIAQLDIQSNIAFIFNFLGAGILNELFWNKYIGKETKYRQRSWVKPAVISLLIITPFVLAMIYA